MDEHDAFEIIKPFFEAMTVTAASYANACNRDEVTNQDMKYAGRFAAMKIVGANQQSMFPEVYESDSEDEEDEEDEDEEEEEEGEPQEFTRYTGDDETMNLVNWCHDNWDTWTPETPIQACAKRAMDAMENH